MILVDDIDNREYLCDVAESMWDEFPEKRNDTKWLMIL